MKLGTHMQVPNTNPTVKFQGQSFIVTSLHLTCVVFKVIEPKTLILLFTHMSNLECNSVEIDDIYIL